MFALSIDKHILGSNLVWVVMASVGMLGMFAASRLTDHDAEAEAVKT
jgi:hypothetical protein